MPKLPQVSGNDLVRLLDSLGYEVIRQWGSYIRLRKTTPLGEHNITVVSHKVIAKETLTDTLNRVSLHNSISKDELVEKLK